MGDEEADLLSDDLLPVLDDPLLGYVGLGGVKADADVVFYADESGNTCANYLDTAQPCNVTGGWLLRANDQDYARRYVQRTIRERKMTELSGPQLLKTKIGRKAALELVSWHIPRIVITETAAS